jgi:hypothetical protein
MVLVAIGSAIGFALAKSAGLDVDADTVWQVIIACLAYLGVEGIRDIKLAGNPTP